MIFNLRVYALIINDKKEILLSDEYRFGQFFTKFPGGGVEKGEGILDALHRELSEEMNFTIDNATPFYYNDFFQLSAFHEEHQIVSFYYLVKCDDNAIQTHSYPIPFTENAEKQRWALISSMNEDNLTFPIDKVVLNKLKTEFLIS